MQATRLPPGFEPLPVYAQTEHIHTHPSLRSNGILAFRHLATGLRLVQFAADGPLVSATILVATEPLSNAGHPHTLEHIVFLGSHRHPRGYLDNLACRCLADGTNAWTDNEFTAYTTVTAGFDGFAHLLPAFLDHIIRPRISDTAFATEVYHVRDDGKEAGVVFCEMQARENTEGDLSDNALRATLLSGTPLQYDSGGLCREIRHLTSEEVERFHYDQYCTSNISVVVGGNVDTYALLLSVKSLLDQVAAAPAFDPRKPSWHSPMVLKPLPPVTRNVIPFPCPDEDVGTIILGWRGPGAQQTQRNLAIDVFMRYLVVDVWSPFRQKFVETENQIASDIFYSQDIFFDVSTVSISFTLAQHDDDQSGDEDEESASEDDDESEGDDDEDMDEDESLDEHEEDETSKDARGRREKKKHNEDSFLTSGKFEKMVMDYLQQISDSGKLPGGISAIHTALKKERETQLAELESSSHEAVPYQLIEELVYSHREALVIGEETRGFLQKYQNIEREDEAYWIRLLRETFLQNPRVEIVMVPDEALADSLAEEEKNALAERVAGLRNEKLGQTKTENEAHAVSVHGGAFDSSEFPPIPSTLNISRWPYHVVEESTAAFASQAVTLNTEFVHCTICIDTSSLPAMQRVFLPILCELVPTCDIRLDDGSCIPYTEHSKALSEARVSADHSGNMLGFDNELAHQCGIIHFVASPDSFERAASLTLQSLFQAEITPERLSVIAQSLFANSTADMRDGAAVLSASVALLPYLLSDGKWSGDPPNFVFANSVGSFPLISFLSDEFSKKKPRRQIQSKIIQQFHDCLDAIRGLDSSNVFVQIAARNPKPSHDVVQLEWTRQRNAFLARAGSAVPSSKQRCERTLPISRLIAGSLSELVAGRDVSRIIGLQGLETSCVDVRVDSPVYEGHSDWSAMTVLTEMLSRMEGPLCNAVRGSGLAYNVSVLNGSWRGHLVASISESAMPAAAWDALCLALRDFRHDLRGKTENKLAVDLETSKAATLYVLNHERSTPESIAMGAIHRTAVGAPSGPLSDRSMEEAVEKVTMNDIADVFDKHVVRLLQPVNRMFVVTCGQNVMKETIAAFAKCKDSVHLVESPIQSLRMKHVDDVIACFT